MRFYNSLTRQMAEFEPLEPGHVRLYTCGPTVYNFAHIGNFRAYVFEDILRRHLLFSGYRVTQVMNLTDVDDKTIRGAREQGVSLRDYTAPYVRAFFEDLDTLNIQRAEHYPAATDHVAEMIRLIEQLFEADCAYKSDDGSVYFNVGAFPGYGRLAHLDMAGLRVGVRVAQDEYDKENVADFALWKAWDEEDGDVVWESPWGRGRPGWHIECSAMSMKYLGETFDIHTGGIDNLFPHHENEIAQSEAATGKLFVPYWLHCGYLVVDGGKMSKSLGNFYTLRDLQEKGYTGREVRYLLFSGQYRQSLNFTFQTLAAARSALGRLDECRARLVERAGVSPADEAPAWAHEALAGFRASLDDDLNMPEALSRVFELVHAANRELDAARLEPEGVAAVLAVLMDMDRVLGVFGMVDEKPDPVVSALVEQRQQARERKDWPESDRIRDELAALGWEVRDTPEGQKLKGRSG